MAPTSEPLTPERVLDVTEAVLRRHGSAKTTVIDVARALGVSHATVYRHFRTKAALREAVVKRWLDHTTAALTAVVTEDRDPESRLRDWLAALFAFKRRTSSDDPELFAAYRVLGTGLGDAVSAHLDVLTTQLTQIIEVGADAGVFITTDPTTSARAVFHATGLFHDPRYFRDWAQHDIEAQFDAVVELVLRGLRARTSRPPGA